MALYDHFTVIHSTIKFTVSVPSNNDQPFIMGVHLDDDATLTEANNVTAVMEQPRTNRKIIAKPSATSGTDLEINHKFVAKEFFGVPTIVGQEEYRGGQGVSPTEQAQFHCFIAPMDATSDLAAYTCMIEIEYTAVFTEPKDLNQS